jgi:tetratricopeptide (TPR) repeat protein
MTVRATIFSGLVRRRSRSSAASIGTEALLQLTLQRICDAGIVVCVLAVPLTMAGIREYGVALFMLCSFVIGITWAAQQLLSPTSNSPIAATAAIASLSIGLVWLQIQPLSNQLLAKLSPFNSEYLTLWGGTQGRILESNGWNQISMTPEATRSGLVLLIAYVIFFLTLTQRLRTQQDVDRLIKLVGISATVMAVIGIAQLLIGDDKFLWIIDHPSRTAAWPAKGTFTNQNHFAHFLALGIGPLVWWWQSLEPSNQSSSPKTPWRSRSRRISKDSQRSTTKRQPATSRSNTSDPGSLGWRLTIGSCAAVLAFGATCSMSRGGIGAFMVASAVAMMVLGTSWKSALRLLGPLAVFLVASVLAFGTEELTSRWNQLTQSHSVSNLSHGRWALWTALSHAIPEFWPAGSGVGSHADVYPIWLSEQFSVRFSHAESGYLQVLLEAGLPGFGLLISGIGLCGWWCIRGWIQGDRQQRRRIIALSAGLLASILHSVVDFVWYIPGCMILTLVIVACVCRCSQLTRPTTAKGHPRTTKYATVFAGVLLVSILPVGQLFADTIQRDLNSLPHWQSFHKDMRSIAKGPREEKVDSLNEQLDTLIGNLEQCTAADPFHHVACTALAPLYLQRFEQRSKDSNNQMTLQDVRGTVREAEFETGQELHEWLTRALGENVKDLYRAVHTARRALRKRPLRSEPYIVLTETAFLTGLDPTEFEAIIDQAVRLRPHDPNVLFAAGLLADDSGDNESAWRMWGHAAALDSTITQQLVYRFVDRIPPTELLHQLKPARHMYWTLYVTYGQAERPEAQKAVAVHFADRHREALANEESGSASDWYAYARLLLTASDNVNAVACLKRAVELQPDDLSTRQLLAETMIAERMFEEAHSELRKLRKRLPDNKRIIDLLAVAETGLTNTN